MVSTTAGRHLDDSSRTSNNNNNNNTMLAMQWRPQQPQPRHNDDNDDDAVASLQLLQWLISGSAAHDAFVAVILVNVMLLVRFLCQRDDDVEEISPPPLLRTTWSHSAIGFALGFVVATAVWWIMSFYQQQRRNKQRQQHHHQQPHAQAFQQQQNQQQTRQHYKISFQSTRSSSLSCDDDDDADEAILATASEREEDDHDNDKNEVDVAQAYLSADSYDHDDDVNEHSSASRRSNLQRIANNMKEFHRNHQSHHHSNDNSRQSRRHWPWNRLRGSSQSTTTTESVLRSGKNRRAASNTSANNQHDQQDQQHAADEMKTAYATAASNSDSIDNDNNNHEDGSDAVDPTIGNNNNSSGSSPADIKTGLCIGSIFGLDVGGTLAKLVYFEQKTPNDDLNRDSTSAHVYYSRSNSVDAIYGTTAVAATTAVADAMIGRGVSSFSPRSTTRSRSTMHHAAAATATAPSSLYSTFPTTTRHRSMSQVVESSSRKRSGEGGERDTSNGYGNNKTILLPMHRLHSSEVDLRGLAEHLSKEDFIAFAESVGKPLQRRHSGGLLLPHQLKKKKNKTAAAAAAVSWNDDAQAKVFPSQTGTTIQQNDSNTSTVGDHSRMSFSMRKSRSMFDLCENRDRAEALDHFYQVARLLDSYKGGIRDHRLSFYSRELGGEFHFIHFETRHMQIAMDLIRSNGLHANICEMGATGGGAHKFANQWENELGIAMKKQDELDSLVAGMQFIINTVVGECYTFRPMDDAAEPGHTHSSPSSSSSSSTSSVRSEEAGIDGEPGEALNIDDCNVGIPLNDEDSANGSVESPVKGRKEEGASDEWWWSRKVQRDAIPDASTYPYLLVTIGTGVSILRVDGPRRYERVSGSTIGGGTYWGLMRLLTDAEDFEDVMRLAERGDPTKIDMMVGDIYGQNSDALEKLGLPANLVASSFGKLVAKDDPAAGLTEEDLARALLLMITINIGQVSYLNAKLMKTRRIYFVGNFLRQNLISQRRLAYAINYWSKGEMEALFLEHEGYFGALGAFLLSQGIPSTSTRMMMMMAAPAASSSSSTASTSGNSYHNTRHRSWKSRMSMPIIAGRHEL